jgi:hypothetical protein
MWIIGVWVVYMGVLLAVSLAQPQHIVAMGQEQCYDEMCFTVTSVERVSEFPAGDQNRLVRISIQIRNKGHKPQNEERIQAYLLDAQGHRWSESTGVSGVRLTATITGGASAVSEPIFRVAQDATNLQLVFTHGRKQLRVLMIGDSDSLLHRRTVVKLER